MLVRTFFVLLASVLFLTALVPPPAHGCCPAPPHNKPVVNADQTVILLWDAATRTQHFIRQASFKSEADDFGFLIPSPSRPELDESGNEAFDFFGRLTEPERVRTRWRMGLGLGCSAHFSEKAPSLAAPPVRVLEEKRVAGFDAVVLEADSSAALVAWLRNHGYAFSPEVAAWARPYVERGWKITALKVAKNPDEKEKKEVAASALRMSFKTDRPLFPYREPDPRTAARSLEARHRLLRIYFVAEARYQGELTREVPWTGRVAWAGQLSEVDRKRALELLKLPATTGPARWWLTEFEDDWPYQAAPADVYFSPSPDQGAVHRPPIEYGGLPFPGDATVYAVAAVVILPPLLRRVRRRRRGDGPGSGVQPA
jgi:hypothetical protein